MSILKAFFSQFGYASFRQAMPVQRCMGSLNLAGAGLAGKDPFNVASTRFSKSHLGFLNFILVTLKGSIPASQALGRFKFPMQL